MLFWSFLLNFYVAGVIEKSLYSVKEQNPLITFLFAVKRYGWRESRKGTATSWSLHLLTEFCKFFEKFFFFFTQIPGGFYERLNTLIPPAETTQMGNSLPP